MRETAELSVLLTSGCMLTDCRCFFPPARTDPAPVQQDEPGGLGCPLLRPPGPGAPHHHVLHRPHATRGAAFQHGGQIVQVPLRRAGGGKKRRKKSGPKLQMDLKTTGQADLCSSFINLLKLIFLTQVSGFWHENIFFFFFPFLGPSV